MGPIDRVEGAQMVRAANGRRAVPAAPAAPVTRRVKRVKKAGAAALIAVATLAVSASLIGVATASSHPPAAAGPSGAPLRARVTGRPIPGTATDAPGPKSSTAIRSLATGSTSGTTLPSKARQIEVLEHALAKMKAEYEQYDQYSPGPQDVWDYGIGSLWKKGIDGAGTTIAVIEGWDYPQIGQQVAQFDRLFGLPNPGITTIFPAGPLPQQCPAGMVKLGSYGSCDAWQGELTLDVISAHLMAPYARILISATPADTEVRDDAASQVAPPEMMKAVATIARLHLANVISISDGTGEITYSRGAAEIHAQDPGELTAAEAGVPVVVATGDCGVVQNLAVANGQCEDVSKGPDTAAWDDSPWVTALGGSVPNLSSSGTRVGADPVWHVLGRFSEGAGYSSIYRRPAYQATVASVTGSRMRSVPDLTMDAQDGTSEAAPLFAGILALATQQNRGGNLGPINPALYGSVGPGGSAAGIADVVSGNNSYETSTGKVVVPGFHAMPGFDVATGWGTIYAPKFVPALVAATERLDHEHAARHAAAALLARLERAIHFSPANIPRGASSYLFATGFLPGHPVELVVDGRQVLTLRADRLGDVSYMLDPGQLHLAPGRHTVRLRSMLIGVSGTVTSS
jgi:hypothetical protein